MVLLCVATGLKVSCTFSEGATHTAEMVWVVLKLWLFQTEVYLKMPSSKSRDLLNGIAVHCIVQTELVALPGSAADFSLNWPALGMWNITFQVQREEDLVSEVEQYQKVVDLLASLHLASISEPSSRRRARFLILSEIAWCDCWGQFSDYLQSPWIERASVLEFSLG